MFSVECWWCPAQITMCIVIMALTNAENYKHKGFNLIGDFLHKFFDEFLRATKFYKTLINITNAVKEETEIEKLIRNKISKLNYLLERNKEITDTKDDLYLRGNNETTVIEFLPKPKRKSDDDPESAIMQTKQKEDPIKSTINRYKRLREQIEMMLDEENIYQGTKTLVIKTLDEMIAQLIESQCTWTSNRRGMKFQNDHNNSLSKVRSMTKKQWKALRKRYLNYLKKRVEKENVFMRQFHDFFLNVINNTYNLSDRYKVRCELVEMHKDDKNPQKSITQDSTNIRKQQCKNFMLCFLELRQFLADFYDSLNDTVVSTFRNYAAMYIRDVNTDLGVDKNVVVSIVNNLGSTAELNVTKLYKGKINKIKLDHNKIKNANIEHLNNFINTAISDVKTVVKRNIANELGTIKSKLFQTVKEDLILNLEVELDNLGRHYNETFCTMFVTCNGRYPARRIEDPWTFRPRTNNEVFVKVQLSLDDEMKDAVIRSGFFKRLQQTNHMKYKISKIGKNKDIVVTRTTIASDIRQTAANLKLQNPQ